MLTPRATTPILAAVLALVLAGCGASRVEPVASTDATLPVPLPAPSGLTATATGASAINLAWNASTDSRVVGYIVARNGAQVGTPLAASFADTGLSPGTTYTYTVRARDAAGNVSPNSNGASATTNTSGADTTPPSTPTGLTATAGGTSSINLSWTASTDNVGVTGYVVFRNGTQVATPTGTSLADTGLSPATTYTYTVKARDAAGNLSPNSTSASATTGTATADTTPPSTPTGLTATTGGTSSINLSWTSSTDNIGVTGYIVFRNGTQVATPVTTFYSDVGLTASTTYSYTVAARDAAGNVSPNSTGASATTSAPNPAGIPPGLGWFSIPNTQFRDICAAENGFPQVAGNTSCSFTVAWSGGVFDTARNRLVIWGGGHSDYAGNEVYALNLDTLTIERLNDPSVPVNNACLTNGIYSDGRPASRHTYNHLAYLPVQDAMFAWGGSMYACGNQGDDAWLFSMSAKTWTKKSSTNGPVGGHFGVSVAYDPNNGLVYGMSDFDIFSYNPATDTWTKRSASDGIGHNKIAAIDPVRKKYFISADADSNLYWYDISSPTGTLVRQSGATSGCGGFIGNSLAAMEYDPVQNRIIGWSGGNTVYILNPDTLSCTQVTYAGGPADVPAGTYGRFRYSPSLNVFVVCNSVDANCNTLRLTP